MTSTASLDLGYRAFCEQHQDHYYAYALIRLNGAERAQRIVRTLLADLHAQWPQIITAPNLAHYAWTTLQQALAGPDRDPVTAATTTPEDLQCLSVGMQLSDHQISTLTGLDLNKIRAVRHQQPPTPDHHAEFEAFLQRWHEPFLRYAVARLLDYHTAHDAVIQTWTRVQQSWPESRRDPTLTADCFQALRQAIDEHYPLAGRYAPTEASSPHQRIEQELRALEGQDHHQADCVRLRNLVGLSYDQVTALLGISRPHARTQTWLGLRHLHDQLTHLTGEETSHDH